jgi:predicted amidohydrolase YtcJ
VTRTTLLIADRVVGVDGAPDVNGLLVEGGSVVAVGPHDQLEGRADTVHEFAGATIVPGLRDAHLHPVPYASSLGGVSLKTAVDLEDVADRLRAAPAAGRGPVVALRFDDETIAERRLPTRTDLDAALRDRPVLIHRYCGHVAVANSAALELAGIDPSTPDPEGGVIDRDAAGAPTGVLRETAIEIVSRALAGALRVSERQLIEAMRALAGLGLTSIGAMVRLGDGPWSSLGNEGELLASVAADLPIRVHGYIIANSVAELDEGRRLLTDRGPRLRWAGVKRFADGSLGGHTAAMIEPYADAAGETGTMRLGPLDLELTRACMDMGGTAAVHAIGDRACREVIDLFEHAGAPRGGCRIEHASVIRRQDILRMARLGIIACVQPAFLGSESQWLADRVGRERLADTYPFESMRRSGVTLAAGSDSPVEPPDPWHGIGLARDRAGVTPEEGLAPHHALDLFTHGAAGALGEPSPLRVGSPADAIVVDRNPLTASSDEIRHTRVHHVFVGGEEVEVAGAPPHWVE